MPQSSHARVHNMNTEFVDIPDTQLRVSRVALGTWAMGGWMWGGTDYRESVATIRAAFEQGVNLIDTAPAYGDKSIGKVGRRTIQALIQSSRRGLLMRPNARVL